jgi:hypothetical protein
MGNQALRHEWPPLMAAVAEHSRRGYVQDPGCSA